MEMPSLLKPAKSLYLSEPAGKNCGTFDEDISRCVSGIALRCPGIPMLQKGRIRVKPRLIQGVRLRGPRYIPTTVGITSSGQTQLIYPVTYRDTINGFHRSLIWRNPFGGERERASISQGNIPSKMRSLGPMPCHCQLTMRLVCFAGALLGPTSFDRRFKSRTEYAPAGSARYYFHPMLSIEYGYTVPQSRAASAGESVKTQENSNSGPVA